MWRRRIYADRDCEFESRVSATLKGDQCWRHGQLGPGPQARGGLHGWHVAHHNDSNADADAWCCRLQTDSGSHSPGAVCKQRVAASAPRQPAQALRHECTCFMSLYHTLCSHLAHNSGLNSLFSTLYHISAVCYITVTTCYIACYIAPIFCVHSHY